MNSIGIIPVIIQLLSPNMNEAPRNAASKEPYVFSTPYEAEGNRIYDFEDLLVASDSIAINDLLLSQERYSGLIMKFLSSETIAGHEDMQSYALHVADSMALGRYGGPNDISLGISAARGENCISLSPSIAFSLKMRIAKSYVKSTSVQNVRLKNIPRLLMQASN
jgi:hypothetical protein